MNIVGKIIGIKYKAFLSVELKGYNIEDFNINEIPSACFLKDDNQIMGISKWVSPKRTRSYPYERIYNTLSNLKKITVIPIIKDEGAKGDRDFIQWDTVSLMSLLDVFVIFAYYADATEKNGKITYQKFDNGYVLSKINEIKQYHSSALHWNLNELKTNLHNLIDRVKVNYSEIEKSTGVKLHNFKGIDNFKIRIGEDVSLFLDYSRNKSEKAQQREFVTFQPKEKLATLSKAKITIENYLGGKYFFTVDEILLKKDCVWLIESKHSVNSILPSKGDIKDGLLKMILYCNLSEIMINDIKLTATAVLCLTSTKLKGKTSSTDNKASIEKFLETNKFTESQIDFIERLFAEAEHNKFTVEIKAAK